MTGFAFFRFSSTFRLVAVGSSYCGFVSSPCVTLATWPAFARLAQRQLVRFRARHEPWR